VEIACVHQWAAANEKVKLKRMVGGLWVISTSRLSGKFRQPASYPLVSLKSISIIMLAALRNDRLCAKKRR